MIDSETRRKVRDLGIAEMLELIDVQQQDGSCLSMPFDERFQKLIDHLYQEKRNAACVRAIRLAKFRYENADVATTYYEGRGIERHAILELATCGFLSTATNVVFQGFTGSGKTWLGCAIGRQACRSGVRTRYVRVPDLLIELEDARLRNRGMVKLLKKYSGFGCLVLDEWLIEDLSSEEQHFFFELMERRYNTSSTVFCTQYKKQDWHSRLGGGAHADAIMDRIVHNTVWVETGKVNMREQTAASPQSTTAQAVS
jgi:DNA replication protein DnaC